MTPVGHAAVGFVLGHVDRRGPWWPWPVVTGAVLPDIDFVMVWHPRFNEWHRVVTHNLAFVAVAACAVGLACVWAGRRGFVAAAAAALLGGLSHLLVDACLDGNASNGLGIAPLWPFDDAMWSPINLVEPSDGGAGWRAPLRAAAGAVRVGAWFELPVVVIAALLGWRARSGGRPRRGSPPA